MNELTYNDSYSVAPAKPVRGRACLAGTQTLQQQLKAQQGSLIADSSSTSLLGEGGRDTNGVDSTYSNQYGASMLSQYFKNADQGNDTYNWKQHKLHESDNEINRSTDMNSSFQEEGIQSRGSLVSGTSYQRDPSTSNGTLSMMKSLSPTDTGEQLKNSKADSFHDESSLLYSSISSLNVNESLENLALYINGLTGRGDCSINQNNISTTVRPNSTTEPIISPRYQQTVQHAANFIDDSPEYHFDEQNSIRQPQQPSDSEETQQQQQLMRRQQLQQLQQLSQQLTGQNVLKTDPSTDSGEHFLELFRNFYYIKLLIPLNCWLNE